MDKLHWILLIISVGAAAAAIMLGLVLTKRRIDSEAGRLIDNAYKSFDTSDITKNAIKDSVKVGNMFDKFNQSSGFNLLHAEVRKYGKPKIRKQFNYIEVDRGSYKSTPYYQCSSSLSIIGCGLTPQQAYENWLKAVIQ